MSASNSPLIDRPWLSAYADGVPDDIATVTQTLADMFDDSVRRFADDVALEFFGATTTYRALGEAVARAAGGLHELGVRAGDRVALVLPNCPQHVIAFYAALRLGAVIVEHNPLYTPFELNRQFADHGAKVAIVWDKVYDTVADFGADTKVDHLIAVDLTTAFPLVKRLLLRLPLASAKKSRAALTSAPSTATFLRWDKLVSSEPVTAAVPRPTLPDTALLQYTSGTTGDPKGAILSHRNLRANAAQGQAWVPGLREGQETFYAVLPLFHAYGLTLCLTFAVSIGAKLVLFPKYDADLVFAALKKAPPSFLPAVPPIYAAMAERAKRDGVDLSSIRYAISGAMALPVATVEAWEQVTGGLLVEGYGMTETSPVALGNPIGTTRQPGTVGVPFPSTHIRVVDPDNPTVDRAAGESGELLIQGPQVFGGYFGKPEESAAVLLDGGWLRTGDIVVVAPDGFVRIVDRVKELIITGGFNVSPSEVEAVLRSHPDVADAAVVGMRTGSGAEEVTGAVVLVEGATLDEKALRDFCRTRLTAYKVPRRVQAVEELPKSLIGKVLRLKVRDLLEAEPKG